MFYISTSLAVILLALVVAIYYCRKKDVSLPWLSEIIRRQYLKTRFKIWDDLAKCEKEKTNGQQQKLSFTCRFFYYLHKTEATILYFLAILFKSSKESYVLLNCDRPKEQCLDEDFPRYLQRQKKISNISMYVLIIMIIANVTTGLITSFIFPDIFKTMAASLSYDSSDDWQLGSHDGGIDWTSSPGDLKLAMNTEPFSTSQSTLEDFSVGTTTENSVDFTSDPDGSLTLNRIYQVDHNDSLTISDSGFSEENPQTIADTDGGVIVVWDSYRQDGEDNWNYDIYAQKFDSNGNRVWGETEKPIISKINDQQLYKIVSDAYGGVIAIWSESVDGETTYFAQRLLGENGSPFWGELGTEIGAEHFVDGADDYYWFTNMVAVPDYYGGVILAYEAYSEAVTYSWDIYAQRITETGTLAWGPLGAEIANWTYSNHSPQIVTDNNHGAVIAWTNNFDWGISRGSIYAQRINENGAIQWTEEGVYVMAAQDDSVTPVITGITKNNDGGAIISGHTEYDSDAQYAQYIQGDGTRLWDSANGIQITSSSCGYMPRQILSDENDGFLASYLFLNGGAPDAYNRYSGGMNSWGNGEGCDMANTTWEANETKAFISDSDGGAYLSWFSEDSNSMYFQHINSDGSLPWPGNGYEMINGSHYNYVDLIELGTTNFITVYDSDGRLYIQRVNTSNTQYSSEGIYTSSIIDNGESIDWTTLSATVNTPENTSISYKTKTRPAIATNLSIGSTAEVSSFYTTLTPDKAIDGEYYTDANGSGWANDFNTDPTPTYEITLPSASTIGYLKIYFAESFGSTYCAQNYTLSYSLDGSSYTEIAHPTDNSDAVVEHSFDPISATKIKMEIATGCLGAITAISEFEIYETNSSWSEWEDVVDGNIQSPDGQYIQYQAILSTTDTAVKPTITDITLNGLRNLGYSASGTYTSAVADAGTESAWQYLNSTSTLPANTSITYYTRSGNTSEPDGTWSEWIEATYDSGYYDDSYSYNFATSSTPTANTSFSYLGIDYTTDKTIDQDTETYWISGESPYDEINDEITPQWLELDFGASQRVGYVKMTSPNICDGLEPSDYEIQTWNGSDWITQVASSSNTSLQMNHEFSPVYTTKLRIYITGGGGNPSYCNGIDGSLDFDGKQLPGFSEVEIYSKNPLTAPNYQATRRYQINSPSGQYLQYQAVLQTTVDNVTPILSSLSLEYNDDLTPPEILASSPINDEENVSTSTVISVTFSEPMATSTINNSTFTLERSSDFSPISGTVEYSGLTAIFTPDSPLEYGQQYNATINDSVEDLAGNTMGDNDSVIWFTTIPAPDTTSPGVDSVFPEDGGTLTIDSVIYATFNESVDCDSVSSSTMTLNKDGITPINGSIECSGNELNFIPSENLEYSTSYTVTINSDLTDLAGNPLEEYSWSFTTEEDTSDVESPTISSVSPAINNQNVAITSSITANFSEDLATSTVTTSSFTLKDQNNNSVSGAVSYANRQAVFLPIANLDCSKEYTATLTTTITDIIGNPLASNYSWSFLTTCTPAGVSGTYSIISEEPTSDSSSTPNSGQDQNSGSSDDSGSSDQTSSANPASYDFPRFSAPSSAESGATPDNTGSTPSTEEENGGLTTEIIEVSTNLNPGTNNPEVIDLKQMLVDLGYLPAETDTANPLYDETTLVAVKQFQANYNLDQTGYVGPLTRAALNKAWLTLSEAKRIGGNGTTPIGTATSSSGGGNGQANENNQTEVNLQISSPESSTRPNGNFVETVKDIYQTIKSELAQSEGVAEVNTALAAGFVAITLIQLAGQVNSASQVPYMFFNLFGFLAYRKKKRAGIVYDAKTGQPVPFAKVTIYDQKSGSAKETKVTDKFGSYFFLVPPGKYTISAEKKGYNHLTAKENTKAKTQYGVPYTKGKIISFDKEDMVNENIPIERNDYDIIDNLLGKPEFNNLVNAIFVVGFAVSVIVTVFNPNFYNLIIAASYIALMMVRFVNMAIPRWGVVKNLEGMALPFTMIEATLEKNKNSEPIGRTVSDQQGRYAFILDAGKYSLEARTTTGIIEKEKIEVKGKRKIVGKNIRIRNK